MGRGQEGAGELGGLHAIEFGHQVLLVVIVKVKHRRESYR